MDGRRLSWKPITKEKVNCYNLEGEYLGYLSLENVGRHIHYCWYQDEGVRMSPGCLEEVRQKQKELFKQRKRVIE